MKPVVPSATDQSVIIRILDSTTFLPVTNVTSASAGLALVYKKGATGSTTALTEGDLANEGSAHSDGGMIHTNTGHYRIDLPDAAVPTAEGEVTLVSGAVTGGIVLGAALVGRVTPLAPTGTLATVTTLTNAPSDSAGVTTLLTRITALLQTKAEADTAHGLLATAASVAALPTAQNIEDEVLNATTAAHATAGTIGKAIGDAGGAADPLTNTVPGSYASGTAGHALGRIGSGQITTLSTVVQNGDINEIIGGADYSNTDGYAFDFTDTEAQWPTLTAATISFRFMAGDQSYAASGSVVTATGASKKIRLELTDTQTLAMQALFVGTWAFVAWATLSGGNVIPLVFGTAAVKDLAGPS